MRHLKTCIGLVATLVGGGMFVGCSRAVAPLISPGESAIALTGGPNTSMIYLARTSHGLLLIDLGWWGSEGAVVRALRELGATPSDVEVVFLTHSHRDHIGAWHLVRHARYYVAAAEYSRLVGDSTHRGWIPQLVNRIKPSTRPGPGELDVRRFSQDTSIVAGSDTVRAYLVPGHTAGSTAYLFRGVLFLGDAATYASQGGFAPAKRGYSDDATLAAKSLEELWSRLPAGKVRYVCTAHAQCTPFSPRFVRDVAH